MSLKSNCFHAISGFLSLSDLKKPLVKTQPYSSSLLTHNPLGPCMLTHTSLQIGYLLMLKTTEEFKRYSFHFLFLASFTNSFHWKLIVAFPCHHQLIGNWYLKLCNKQLKWSQISCVTEINIEQSVIFCQRKQTKPKQSSMCLFSTNTVFTCEGKPSWTRWPINPGYVEESSPN